MSVYVIGSDKAGPVKIGIAVDVPRRLSQLQGGSVSRLRVFSELACGRLSRRIESQCHRELREQGAHLCGEWFQIDAETAEMLVHAVYHDLRPTGDDCDLIRHELD